MKHDSANQPSTSASEKHHNGTKTHLATLNARPLAATQRPKSATTGGKSHQMAKHDRQVVRVRCEPHEVDQGPGQETTKKRVHAE